MNGGSKYPLPDEEEYDKFINKFYHKFQIPKEKKTFNQICFPKQYELQIPQRFISEYINPKTPYDSILVVHKIGAGKTCTAIRVAEVWKHKRQIIFLVPASLKGNLYNELRSECTGTAYITDEERKLLKTLEPKSAEYKEVINKTEVRIHKYYEIYSYNKFVELYNDKKINLVDKVLIVDEIQNMVSDGGSFYETLSKAITSARKKGNLRTILLSATPIFDKPYEIALTLNLLNLNTPLPTGKDFEKKFIITKYKPSGVRVYDVQNINYFKECIKGFVSYYRGAPPYVFPQMNLHYVKCEMEKFQYESYNAVFNKESEIIKYGKETINDLPSNFYIGSRIISNIAFPNLNIGKKGFGSLNASNVGDMDKLRRYSIKFYKILKKINSSKGPVFFYSNFKGYGGIQTFAKILELYGFLNYTENGAGKNRYAVWSGDISPSIRDEIRTMFNKKENTKGHIIKVILGSPSMKEGVSLFRVKQVHILEPYWNQARMDQVIGRAVRFCSHKDLDEEDRLVHVYIYITVHPKIQETVDQRILSLSKEKSKINNIFFQALKESAVDCELFKYGNMDSKDNYKCDSQKNT